MDDCLSTQEREYFNDCGDMLDYTMQPFDENDLFEHNLFLCDEGIIARSEWNDAGHECAKRFTRTFGGAK